MAVELRMDVVEELGERFVRVMAGNKERFEFHGFGTFMKDINPGEIECTQEALDFLLECPERSGLNGLEFWPQKMMAWGTQDQVLMVPLEEINVPEKAKEWIMEFKVVEREKWDGK